MAPIAGPHWREALDLFVAQARRAPLSLRDTLALVRATWREVCATCGEVSDFHDSHGGHMCTRCADPEEVREFMEGST